jgi:predicted nuclease of predicted toxin-antitoxin system
VKLLLDACVWGGAVDPLRAAGHDVIWAGAWDIDPGDDDILARAHQEGRVLVTLDKDFGELAVVRGQPHTGIVRLVMWSALQQPSICLTVLTRYGTELEAGAIVTVEPGRIRVRPAAQTPESS